MAGRIIMNLRKNMKFAVWLFTCLFLTGMLAGCAADLPSKADTAQSTAAQAMQEAENPGQTESGGISEDGSYSSKEEVALYLHTYGHLPDNYISKKEAEAITGTMKDCSPNRRGGSIMNAIWNTPGDTGRQNVWCIRTTG